MNFIHPTAIVEDNVVLGSNNRVDAYSVLRGPLSIGDNNIIGPHVVIGTPGQDTRNPRYDSSSKRIQIGSDNIIREFTAIQKPCYEATTRLGSGIYLMQGVHVPHDAIIEDSVVITPYVVLGGLAKILEGANLAMSCSVHQRLVVGQYSIVAMGAAVVKNVKPFSRYIPGKDISVNKYAVEKYGFEDELSEITDYVKSDTRPKSARLLGIIEYYESAQMSFERGKYR